MSGFKLRGQVTGVTTIAVGRKIRELPRLIKLYGSGRWRKLKGVALVELTTSRRVVQAELHWYEAHGVGRVEMKIKRLLG